MKTSLTEKEASVLSQLTSGEKYGLDLVSGSAGLLHRSAVYVLLGRMEDSGLINGREEFLLGLLLPRRIYKITELGRQHLLTHEQEKT